MNCLSHRAFARAIISVGVATVASLVVLTGSGAYAGSSQRGPSPEDAGPVAPPDEARIVFSGSAMAPLVCSSTPDPTSITITEDSRITLANLTGADASLDTGTAQILAVGDGVGISVKFRPGQYTVRMVPDCAVTNDVGAALVSVTVADDPVPSPTPAPSAPDITPTPDLASPSGQGAQSSAPPRPLVDASGSAPATATATATPRRSRRASGGGGPVVPPSLRADTPAPAASTPSGGSGIGVLTRPTRSTATSAAPPPVVAEAEPAIYDVFMVQLQLPGDPRDSRLLAVIAVICVFGVTMAIIRAILSQRARRVVST